MKIAFYGGQTAGLIALLTLLAKDYQISYVVPEDGNLESLAKSFRLTIRKKDNLDDDRFIKKLAKEVDFFLCCHGKKILKKRFIELIPSINIHPCLYKYKGQRPIKRLIAEGNQRASVASHWMAEKVDQGAVIIEKFKNIDNIKGKTEAEVYNELYPLYQQVIVKTLKKISK